MLTKQRMFLKEQIKELKTKLMSPSWLMSEKMVFLGALFGGALIFLFTIYAFSLWQNREAMKASLVTLELKGRSFSKREEKKALFLQNYKGSDTEYLEHHVKPLYFLQKDTDLLERLLSETNREYTPIEKRHSFLKSEQNSLSFVKLTEKAERDYLEMTWGLLHPVEMSYEDLQRLLALIEGKKIGRFTPEERRPELFFKKFTLTPKEGGAVFLIDFEIVQREPHA
jgi:hypothetical protein